jgi:UDP-glucose:(heptosyl)LPS alpha-1,3-glucosyltransferase
MKIIHVYPYFNRLGGIEKYLLDTLPLQLDSGKDIELVGAKFDQDVLSKYACRRVRCLSTPAVFAMISFVLAAEFVVKRLRKPGNRMEIIHSQGASCFTPDMITAHSCHKAWFLQSMSQLRPMSKAWFKKILNPLHYWTIFVESIQYGRRSKTHVIAISNGIKSELQKYFGVAESRISVVHSGVDCEKYHPGKRDKFRSLIRNSHGLTERDCVLVFVANEFRRKGLKAILGAMRQCFDSHLKLLVIGKDDPRDYELMADNLDIREQVIFVGRTPHVDQYYAASDVFVFPTLYEPFGLVATEAMASGLPVIISELAGAAELMTDGLDCIKLRDPSDSAEIAAGLRLMSSKKVRDEMGLRARDTALNHQWRDVVKRIDQVYLAWQTQTK